MLSFPATHAITGELIAAARSAGWSNHPLLLIIQDRPAGHPHIPDARHLRVTPVNLPEQLWSGHPGGVTGVLDDLAACTAHPMLPTDHDDGFAPDARTLAVAVCYDDIATDAGSSDVAAIRRVDAVDIDDRVYQITQLPNETQAVAIVDEQPDPLDTPATRPGLRGLLDLLRHQPAS